MATTKYREQYLLSESIESLNKLTNVKVTFYQESNLFTLRFDNRSIIVRKGIRNFNATLLAIIFSLEHIKNPI